MSGQEAIKTMQCPFNPNHVMPYERFLNHLEKCQFPDKKSYRKCKFNPYHVIHMDQLTNHQNKCPDKKKYQTADDDDWGVSDSPPKEELEPSYVSYSSKSKEEIGSKYTSSSASYESYESSAKSNQKSGQSTNNHRIKKTEKETINNTVLQVEDLDDFNPQ